MQATAERTIGRSAETDEPAGVNACERENAIEYRAKALTADTTFVVDQLEGIAILFAEAQTAEGKPLAARYAIADSIMTKLLINHRELPGYLEGAEHVA